MVKNTSGWLWASNNAEELIKEVTLSYPYVTTSFSDVDEWNALATNKFDTHLDIEEAKREKESSTCYGRAMGARAMDDKRRIQIHDQA